ncbi:D-arabinose 1-dehydrogenase (NAD(P)(+)) ARA2 [Ascoidea rubescens DSM 1968]|uniref:Aldo/keto reductase n=1 Tax=Ascoidea rubescens DSM 1968 TaxID=1344418 RepID=A0A1D2V9L2_9ASCO|nr:Aldo/keto reductase [Ascoidea rubescens DSM 1968]ODV58153.1 Aldo/keto reductase [Ascoidea rubescens DSM 1968]
MPERDKFAGLRPVGPVGQPVSGNICDLPPLILGGAVFNYQYNDDPQRLPVKSLIKLAFDLGVTAIDTSPYYGPSEELIGGALKDLSAEYPRSNYYICTKVGRIQLDDFDYGPDWIESSINRSLERLNTSYLDLVHLHDIEFVSTDKIFLALKKLKSLKDRQIIHNFGISGYPVDFLSYVSKKCAEDFKKEIGSLDSILSYSNMCLQNTILLNYYDSLKKISHLKQVLNGSILSMSLLRSMETRSFHPASTELKKKADEVANLCVQKYNVELADLATRFAIREWLKKGPTVLGVDSISQLQAAVSAYWDSHNDEITQNDKIIIKDCQDCFGIHLNETWQSGIKHHFD